MNVPQFRFDGFDGEWKKTHIGEISIKIQDGNYGGKYPTNEEFLKFGIPFLTGKVLGKTGRIDEKKIDYISIEKHKELSKAHIQTNDILFTNRGASVGAIGFNDGLIQDGNIGPQLTLIRADTEKILSKLLFQIIKAPTVQRQILESDSGSAMKFFGIESTKKFKIAFPVAKGEQKKIVSFFNLLDRKIEKQIEKVEKLEQFKKGMMQKIFSQELRFKDEDGGEFGEWEEALFGEVVTNKSDKHDPKKETIILPCIELENIEQGSGQLIGNIDNRDQQSMKNKFGKGSVLFGKLRPYLKKYLYTKFEGLCSTEIWVLSSKDSRIINEFIYFFIQGTEFLETANKSIGSKMPRADWNSVSELPLKIPIIKEQGKIVGYLQALENKIVKEKEKLMVLEEQKKGFMQGMFI